MVESIFAALFLFSLIGQVLAVIAGFALLVLPAERAVTRSMGAPKEAHAHA